MRTAFLHGQVQRYADMAASAATAILRHSPCVQVGLMNAVVAAAAASLSSIMETYRLGLFR